MRLANKIAIVTGGARGIGKAISELFAKEGAQVIIWDLLDVGQKTAESIQANGGKATFTKISVTDKEAVEAETKRIFEEYGRLDILANNAGIVKDRTLLKMSMDEWNAVLNVNLTGVFICTQACVPYMIENKYGRIITAASTSGMRGNYGQSNYSATKAGVIGMSKTWTLELGKFGITANVIAPGYTVTDMTATIPEETAKMFAKQIPVRFLGDPMDIAHGYLYFASPEARYVSGVCLNIDGGASR